MPYELEGRFLEACDCFVLCPCWLGKPPDQAACTGLFGWQVTEGNIDSVDVSGLSVVSISHHSGDRRSGGWRVALFVDEKADERQAQALVQAFAGRLGGPLAELADLTEEVVAVERATIRIVGLPQRRLLPWGTGAATVSVGSRVEADMRPLVGTSGRVTTLHDGALGGVLGTPAEIGTSMRYRVALPEAGFNLDVWGRSGTRGRFAYRTTDSASA